MVAARAAVAHVVTAAVLGPEVELRHLAKKAEGARHLTHLQHPVLADKAEDGPLAPSHVRPIVENESRTRQRREPLRARQRSTRMRSTSPPPIARHSSPARMLEREMTLLQG